VGAGAAVPVWSVGRLEIAYCSSVGAESMTALFTLADVLYFIPLVLAYFITDRLLSKYYTGSWWKQPSDVEGNDEL